MIAWICALSAQAFLAWRLPAGPVRELHLFQVAWNLGLLAVSLVAPGWYAWFLACFRLLNAGMLVSTCEARFRPRWTFAAAMLLFAVMAGSDRREWNQPYLIRWLLLAVGVCYWIGAAWPERWLTAYAVLIYGFALAALWNWHGSSVLDDARQWAQAALFVAWATCQKRPKPRSLGAFGSGGS